jgi:hypothetical protein
MLISHMSRVPKNNLLTELRTQIFLNLFLYRMLLFYYYGRSKYFITRPALSRSKSSSCLSLVYMKRAQNQKMNNATNVMYMPSYVSVNIMWQMTAKRLCHEIHTETENMTLTTQVEVKYAYNYRPTCDVIKFILFYFIFKQIFTFFQKITRVYIIILLTKDHYLFETSHEDIFICSMKTSLNLVAAKAQEHTSSSFVVLLA